MSSISKTKPYQQNKRGRPTLARIIKFSPQPKSIISQLLNKMKKNASLKHYLNSQAICVENCVQIEKKTYYESNIVNQSNYNNDISFSEHLQFNRNFKESIGENNCNDNDESYLSKTSDSFLNVQTEEIKVYQINTSKDMQKVICKICSHKSNNKKEHRNHLIVHKNKLYTCDYPNCLYTFKLSSNLIKHKRIHTAEKPYLCDQCTFRSNFVNSLKVHKRIHTSERPYSCKHCNYKCNSSSNLKKHCLHRHSTHLNAN